MKAIIIDDEPDAVQTLKILLNRHCADVEVVESCLSGSQALEAVARLQPDLVFLDIEMPKMNGFAFLERFSKIPFAVIFTTSYDQYAIKAIRVNALDYLLKPVDPKELVAAVRRIREQPFGPTREQVNAISERMLTTDHQFSRIALPTTSGYEMVSVSDILYCEVDDNFSFVTTKNKGRLIVCRTLKEVEAQLADFRHFLRVHNSYLVNLNEVERYVRGEGGYLTMSDGKKIDVSRSRKEGLIKRLHRTE